MNDAEDRERSASEEGKRLAYCGANKKK